MKSLDNTIGLWMVCCGGGPVDVQEGAEGRPHRTCELRAAITGYGGRYTKTLDLAYQQGLCAVCGSG
jgi:hypothetical protein